MFVAGFPIFPTVIYACLRGYSLEGNVKYVFLLLVLLRANPDEVIL